MEKEYEEISRRNLNKILAKIEKYPKVRSEAEVESAIKALNFYHCVRQANIMQVLKDREIKIKKEIENAEMTNASSDFIQGFDKHISMSIGQPWTEYGEYSFAYGIDHISENAFFFDSDPWQDGSHELEKGFFTKQDFITLTRETLSKNLWNFSGRQRFIKVPLFNKDLHALAKKNFKQWEVKQTENLKLDESDEFFLWTQMDATAAFIVRLLWSTAGLLVLFFMFMMITLLAVTG